MSYFLLVITFLIALLQIENLKKNPPRLKAWIILLLTIAATVTSFIVESNRSKEEKYSRDSGTLSPFPANNKALIWELLGDTLIFPNGEFDFSRVKVQYLLGIKFNAKLLNDKILVTADVRDSTGNLIARLNNNEWILNTNSRLDKNFDDNALEVIDNSGNIVFQIEILNNRFFLQGLFYQPNGNATAIIQMELKGKKKTIMLTFINEGYRFPIPPHPLLKSIEPIFKYPSSIHKGERVNQKL